MLFQSVVYGFFFDGYRTRTENIIIDFSAAIRDSIRNYVEEPQGREPKRVAAVVVAGVDASTVPSNEEQLTVEIAKLIDEKERLEKQVASEKEKIVSQQDKVEQDISATNKELVEVREQIGQTDNTDKQEALKQQEGSQVKLLTVLEKLKQTQQKHYEEAEVKLQSELGKIEELIAARKKRQQELQTAIINNFADNTRQDINNAPKKDMNTALSELITTMDKVNTDSVVAPKTDADLNATIAPIAAPASVTSAVGVSDEVKAGMKLVETSAPKASEPPKTLDGVNEIDADLLKAPEAPKGLAGIDEDPK